MQTSTDMSIPIPARQAPPATPFSPTSPSQPQPHLILSTTHQQSQMCLSTLPHDLQYHLLQTILDIDPHSVYPFAYSCQAAYHTFHAHKRVLLTKLVGKLGWDLEGHFAVRVARRELRGVLEKEEEAEEGDGMGRRRARGRAATRTPTRKKKKTEPNLFLGEILHHALTSVVPLFNKLHKHLYTIFILQRPYSLFVHDRDFMWYLPARPLLNPPTPFLVFGEMLEGYILSESSEEVQDQRVDFEDDDDDEDDEEDEDEDEESEEEEGSEDSVSSSPSTSAAPSPHWANSLGRTPSPSFVHYFTYMPGQSGGCNCPYRKYMREVMGRELRRHVTRECISGWKEVYLCDWKRRRGITEEQEEEEEEDGQRRIDYQAYAKEVSKSSSLRPDAILNYFLRDGTHWRQLCQLLGIYVRDKNNRRAWDVLHDTVLLQLFQPYFRAGGGTLAEKELQDVRISGRFLSPSPRGKVDIKAWEEKRKMVWSGCCKEGFGRERRKGIRGVMRELGLGKQDDT